MTASEHEVHVIQMTDTLLIYYYTRNRFSASNCKKEIYSKIRLQDCHRKWLQNNVSWHYVI